MGTVSALAWRTQEFQVKVEAFEGRAPAASWFSSPLVVCLGASKLENMSRERELEADKARLVFSPRNKGLNVEPLSHLEGWGLCQSVGPGPTASLLAFAVVNMLQTRQVGRGLGQPGPVQGVPACRVSYK